MKNILQKSPCYSSEIQQVFITAESQKGSKIFLKQFWISSFRMNSRLCTPNHQNAFTSINKILKKKNKINSILMLAYSNHSPKMEGCICNMLAFITFVIAKQGFHSRVDRWVHTFIYYWMFSKKYFRESNRKSPNKDFLKLSYSSGKR